MKVLASAMAVWMLLTAATPCPCLKARSRVTGVSHLARPAVKPTMSKPAPVEIAPAPAKKQEKDYGWVAPVLIFSGAAILAAVLDGRESHTTNNTTIVREPRHHGHDDD